MNRKMLLPTFSGGVVAVQALKRSSNLEWKNVAVDIVSLLSYESALKCFKAQ